MFDDRHFDKFDRTHDRMMKGMMVAWVASAVVSLSVLAFIIWAIVQLMQHFNVI